MTICPEGSQVMKANVCIYRSGNPLKESIVRILYAACQAKQYILIGFSRGDNRVKMYSLMCF